MRRPPMPASRRRRPSRPPVQVLEARQLFAAVSLPDVQDVVAPIPNRLATVATPATDSVSLSGVFNDPNVPGTLVTFQTSKGPILVALADNAVPATVANFLAYANTGAYNNTIFHRSALFTRTGDISKSNPADIIQGGGYVAGQGGLDHIPTNPAIPDQYLQRPFGDVEGTIAMAKTANSNSATSEFFFNNTDNTTALDTPTTDVNKVLTSYTTFGHVLVGMDVVGLISALPTAAVAIQPGVQNPATSPAPVTRLTQTQISQGAAIGLDNLVYVYGVVAQPGTTYTVTSSDPGLVNPSVSGGTLNFAYPTAGRTGTATVTVTATGVFNATATASTTFAVTVPPTGLNGPGPQATADAVPAAVTGVPTVIRPLSNDTDAASPLVPASVTITTQPAHGTATVDPTTGAITYTPTAGFTGDDAVQYTVADAAGTVSAATNVAVHVVPTPRAVPFGAGQRVKTVVLTQPDGTRGAISVANATATVTFSPGDTTTTTRGAVQTITGPGATIANVAVINTGRALANITVQTIGKGTVTIGGVTAAGAVAAFTAPRAVATGSITLGGVRQFTLGSARGANLFLGTASGNTVVNLPTAQNTNLTAGTVTQLTSQSWTNTDGGAYTVNAANITTLSVPGTFANNLFLTGVDSRGYGLDRATVTAPSGQWSINAAVRVATITKPTAAWSLSSGSTLQNVTVRGDLLSGITAAAISRLTVTGGLTNATVETTGTVNAAATQLDRLTINGAVTDSVIFAAGNVNRVAARSLTNSRIYAGVNVTFAQQSALPTVATDLTTFATIKNVLLAAGRNTFVNSEISAYTLGVLRLGQTPTANKGTPFGVAAHTVRSIATTLAPGGPLSLSGPALQTPAALARVISRRHAPGLGDFRITLF